MILQQDEDNSYKGSVPPPDKNAVNDYLANMLPPDLQARYRQKRMQAMQQQQQAYQSPEEVDALKDTSNMRNLAAGLQNAANQFGSNPLTGQSSGGLDISGTMGAMNQEDQQAFAAKQKLFQQANADEQDAVQGLLGLEKDAMAQEQMQRENDWKDQARAQEQKQWGYGDQEQQRKAEQYASQQSQMAEADDPNSDISRQYQALASKLTGGKGNYAGLSASKLDKLNPMLTKAYEIDQRRMDRSEARADKQADRAAAYGEKLSLMKEKQIQMQDKQGDKEALLNVPGLGQAITPDDAKQLKESTIAKKNFDSKINEMIALREKHKGGSVLNRTDVARGQQLSKDLLLAYKNMQKLGVLSKSDEDIINAIIPADPLQFNSPLAAIQGQDPILSNLKKFKADSENDYNETLNLRLKSRTQPAVSEQTKPVSSSGRREWTP